ncbi:cadherin domain-containing protein [Candidatus Poriferisodalis sp.]|uniref:cadherin domain-containing protein n=1 Tax=Candidatus Poriferisodalis sp. TaxID=3101277 RepID=UPI003B52DDEE
MKTRRSSASRLLAGASALLLVLFLPSAPAEAADNVARQEVVPTVTITAGATTHNEPDGPMSFTLHASPAPATNLEVKLGSRQTGVVFTDAIERSFTETIPAGEPSYDFDFIVVNDLVVEPEGTVTITVADSEVHYEVGTPSEAVTTLVDDDVPITVSWDSSTVHVNEDAGTVTVPFFIRVHDGKPPGTFKSADGVHEGVAFVLTTASVTADATMDFVYQSYFYIWDVGSFTVDASGDYTLSDQIEIEIIDDTEDEPGETFVLYFESPLPAPLDVGDTVIPTDRKTIVIADDDGVNNAPEFTATAEQISVSEDIEAGTLIGVSFEATDFDGHEVTFGVVGDSLPFEIDAETDTLRVTGALDFETQAEYTFAVAASDVIGGSSETNVTVTVTNVDEPGVVKLAPMTPEEGAMVEATLSDVDGPVDDMTWEWSQGEAPDGGFDPIDGQTDDHYMPTPDDVGMYLRATATYTDGEGAGKSADATTSEPVAARQEVSPEVTIRALTESVDESDRTVSVELSITRPLDDDLRVELEITDPDNELLHRNGDPLVVRIRAGSTSQTAIVYINNDSIVENDGSVLFTIVLPEDAQGNTAYAIGSPDTATVAMHDDDTKVTVLYTENPFIVAEEAGTVELPITVRVDGNQPPGTYELGGIHYEGQALAFTATPGTATNPADFEPPPAFIDLELGSFVLQESGSYEASGVATVTILDDDLVEEGESFSIEVGPGPGVRPEVTLPAQALDVVIEDDDGTTDPPDPPRPPWPPPDFCPTNPDTVADTSTPLSMEVGGSVEADFCSKDDADWVQVFLEAGQAYRIEGTFNGPDRETSIFIGSMRESDGSLITGSHSFDGNPYGTSNTAGYINFRPTATGIHFIVAGDPNWWNFTNATAPLPWHLEIHEIDLSPDDVPGVTELTLEFNNYGYFVDEFEGTVDTHGDRDTFAIDVEAGHRYFVEMRNRNGSGIFNCIHGIASAETPDQPGANSRECWHRVGWKASRWIIPDADGRKLITVGSDNGTGDYLLRVRDYSAVPPGVWDTPLPHGDLAQDTSTTGLVYVNDSWVNGTAVRGEIDLAGDKDWFQVELEGGRRYQIDIRGEGSGVGTLRNSFMWIHDASGQRIVFASGGGSYLETRLVWTPPSTGTYFIGVAGSSYEIGTYDLSVIDFEDLYTTHRPS